MRQAVTAECARAAGMAASEMLPAAAWAFGARAKWIDSSAWEREVRLVSPEESAAGVTSTASFPATAVATWTALVAEPRIWQETAAVF